MEGFVFSAKTMGDVRMEGDPPDGGRLLGKEHQGTRGISFRDMVMGNKQPPPRWERTNLVEKKLAHMEFIDGDEMKPMIYLDDNLFQELCLPWQDALVIKLLGKTVGFLVLRDRLRSLWRLQGGFEMVDVGNGFFMVKFDLEEDRYKVMTGGLWMVFDHYLAIQTWMPEFISPKAKIQKTLVWIRFSGLNMLFYDESVLLTLASALGTPIKVDSNTVNGTRGRFARVCVEMDIMKPVKGKVGLQGHW